MSSNCLAKMLLLTQSDILGLTPGQSCKSVNKSDYRILSLMPV